MKNVQERKKIHDEIECGECVKVIWFNTNTCFCSPLSEIQYASMQRIFRTKSLLAFAVVATEVLENRWHSFDQAPSIFR